MSTNVLEKWRMLKKLRERNPKFWLWCGIRKADLISIGACRLQVAAMTRVGQVDPLTTALCSPLSQYSLAGSGMQLRPWSWSPGRWTCESGSNARSHPAMHSSAADRPSESAAGSDAWSSVWSVEWRRGRRRCRVCGRESGRRRGTEEGRLGGYMWWTHTLVRRMPSDGGCCCFLFGAFWKRPKNNKQKWKTPFGGA